MAALDSRHISGLALGAGGAALFSLKGIIMKLAFAEGASVEQMMSIRMGTSLPVYLVIGWLVYRARKQTLERRTLLLAAALGFLSYYICTWLDFTGLLYISAQFERLILFCYPTVTALLAWAFLGDRLTYRHCVALVLSYSGVAILFGRELQDLGPNAGLGAALVFAAAALFAVYVTAAKPVITALGSRLFTSVAMATAAMAILLHFSIDVAVSGAPPVNAAIIWYGVALGLGCTIAPSFMISEAIARIGPGLSSAVGGFGPAATAVVAVFVLGEPFGFAQAAALALTVGGVLLLAAAKPAEEGNARARSFKRGIFGRVRP